MGARLIRVAPILRVWVIVRRAALAEVVLPFARAFVFASKFDVARAFNAASLVAITICVASAFVIAPASAGAGVRGEVWSRLAIVESQSFIRERIDESEVGGEGLWRRLPDGTIVVCIPGEDCYRYRPNGIETTTPLVHELRLTGWSGARGVSGRLHLRSRQGSDSFWPRSADRFELVSGLAELDRWGMRLRAGRLSRLTGLGFHEWDGASALWRPGSRFEIELFGGRSLARGVGQPVTGFLIEDADEYAPDRSGVLLGGEIFARASRQTFATFAYQRTIRTDRGALYSEQIAAELHGARYPLSIDLSTDYDVIRRGWNDARGHLAARLGKPWQTTFDIRYRRPHFDLWTIWEAFSPIGYTESRVGATWTDPSRRLDLSAGAAYRNYDETENEISFLPVRDDGWQVDTRAALREGPWRWSAAYRVNIGYGAAGSHFDLASRRALGSAFDVGVSGSVSQQTREFRIGEDWIWGGGLELGLRFSTLTFRGSAGWYRLSYQHRADSPDWSQKRASIAISYAFGHEPGDSAHADAVEGNR